MVDNVHQFPTKQGPIDEIKEHIDSCHTGLVILWKDEEPYLYFVGESFDPGVARAIIDRAIDGLSELTLRGEFNE